MQTKNIAPAFYILNEGKTTTNSPNVISRDKFELLPKSRKQLYKPAPNGEKMTTCEAINIICKASKNVVIVTEVYSAIEAIETLSEYPDLTWNVNVKFEGKNLAIELY